MWPWALLPALCLMASGCARSREYSAPAPPDALQCALSHAEEMGYTRISGEPEERYVRVSQRLEPPPARQADADPLPGDDRVRPVYRDRPLENQLMLRLREGRLRIQVLGLDEEGREVRAGRDAEAHAQMIVAACST